MHLGSRLFVFIVYAVLGISFWAVTAQLYLEFADLTHPLVYKNKPWFLLITHYSDLFIFFPLFGSIALIAFFKPAVVLVDMYWNLKRQGKHRIPNSKFRFTLGFVLIVFASFGIAEYVLNGSERTIWQLKPATLKADQGAGCSASGRECQRVSFLNALSNIQKTSRARIKIADLKRTCTPDWFIAPPSEKPPARYCAVTTNINTTAADIQGRWLPDAACCRAQKTFDAALKSAFSKPSNRSHTHQLQRQLWPLNIFFLLTLLVISGLLALRRKQIEDNYAEASRSIDRGVLVGTLAMVFLPLMNRAFLLSTTLLHGDSGIISVHRMPDVFIILFVFWTVLIVLSFLHPANKQAEPTSRIFGVIASVAFALNADTITGFAIRYLGAGADVISLGVAVGTAIVLLLVLIIGQRRGKAATDAQPPEYDEARLARRER